MVSDWYVLHVTTGKEQTIKEKIKNHTPKTISITTFQREIIHSRKGSKVKVLGPLFPGYIFVNKEIKLVCEIAKKYISKEFICPVSINGKPGLVYKDEMELLLGKADNSGTFRLSHGLKVGDKVEVTDGPLKTLQGHILWIDEKKSKAKVELSLFKRKMRVNLGIEIITL